MLELVQKRAMREAQHMMARDLGVPEISLKLIHSTITTVRSVRARTIGKRSSG